MYTDNKTPPPGISASSQSNGAGIPTAFDGQRTVQQSTAPKSRPQIGRISIDYPKDIHPLYNRVMVATGLRQDPQLWSIAQYKRKDDGIVGMGQQQGQNHAVVILNLSEDNTEGSFYVVENSKNVAFLDHGSIEHLEKLPNYGLIEVEMPNYYTRDLNKDVEVTLDHDGNWAIYKYWTKGWSEPQQMGIIKKINPIPVRVSDINKIGTFGAHYGSFYVFRDGSNVVFLDENHTSHLDSFCENMRSTTSSSSQAAQSQSPQQDKTVATSTSPHQHLEKQHVNTIQKLLCCCQSCGLSKKSLFLILATLVVIAGVLIQYVLNTKPSFEWQKI